MKDIGSNPVQTTNKSKKMNNKIFLKVVALIALFFLVVPWTFNHINPWAAIAILITAAYWVNAYINKFIGK